jgi:hypothetical protein
MFDQGFVAMDFARMHRQCPFRLKELSTEVTPPAGYRSVNNQRHVDAVSLHHGHKGSLPDLDKGILTPILATRIDSTANAPLPSFIDGDKRNPVNQRRILRKATTSSIESREPRKGLSQRRQP